MIPLEIGKTRFYHLNGKNNLAYLKSKMIFVSVILIMISTLARNSCFEYVCNTYAKYVSTAKIENHPGFFSASHVSSEKFQSRTNHINELINTFEIYTNIRPNRRNIVTNLDMVSSFNSSTYKGKRNLSKRKVVHFVFIGDSRIRQHFLNVLKLIPDYDLKYEPRFMSSFKVNDDMNVTSNVLNLRISFYFRRWLTTETTEAFLQLVNNFNSHTHRVTLIGISLHHMLDNNGTVNFEQYKENLTTLSPILNHLTKKSPVLWLNQYPTFDSFYTLNGHPEVFSEKIHHYNLATERILRETGVIWWNSGNIVVEEYIRSCFLLERADNWRRKLFGLPYFDCYDYVHPGYVVMGEIIHFLMLNYANLKKCNFA